MIASQSSEAEVVLVGNPGVVHVGAHLRSAADAAGVNSVLCDVREAFTAPFWAAKANWYLRGHRPTRLRDFSQRVERTCLEFRPRWLLATGLAPIDARALTNIGAM